MVLFVFFGIHGVVALKDRGTLELLLGATGLQSHVLLFLLAKSLRVSYSLQERQLMRAVLHVFVSCKVAPVSRRPVQSALPLLHERN